MTVLHALSYLAGAVGFVFVLLSLASGLLYVAEVIEEHSALAKKVGQGLIGVIIVILTLLHFVDGLPWHLSLLGVVSHLVYLQNFSKSWPVISLTSPAFIASCVLVITSHFVSFQHFSHRATNQGYGTYSHGRGRYGGPGSPTGSSYKPTTFAPDESFMDVATYFALLVWLVPFYLFLSLSANDNALPLAGDSPRVSTATQPLSASASHAGEKARPPPIQITESNHAPAGRHQRKHSSILKKSFVSAFSLVPAALKPASRGGMSAQRSGLIASPVRSHPPSPALGLGFANGSPNLGAAAWGGGPGTPPVGPPPRSPVLGASAGASAGGNYFGGEPQRRDSLHAPGVPMRRHTSDDGLGIGSALVGEPAGLGFSLSGRDSPSLGARSGWDSPVSMSPRLGAVSGFESAQAGGAAGLSKRK